MDGNEAMASKRVLLTGATGYIGGRLLRRLLTEGYQVRCLVRRPELFTAPPGVEVVGGDVLDAESLRVACSDVAAAYYLIHSMGSSSAFEQDDRIGASNFARAARVAGVQRIIYLGGLGEPAAPLSPHLRSRHEVGEILRRSGGETFELRASIVIGSGSLSFEMVRTLTERLPVMITPRWVSVPAQPIAVDDVLAYLMAALRAPVSGSRVFEIGGADVVSYADIIREYARQRGLRRALVRSPLLTPRLSSLWLGLVTPLYARVGRKLIDSICHSTIVRDRSAERLFEVHPLGLAEAIRRALRNEDQEVAETRWTDALSAATELRNWGGVRFGSRIVDSRALWVDAPPAAAFTPIRRIGGRVGWYYGDWLWSLRGLVDIAVGGPGMRRGRRDADLLGVGDVLDCWRVEAFEADRLLRLRAEMKLPGRAWLEFRVSPDGDGARIEQTAIFDPIGLGGQLYWYVLYPVHRVMFANMIASIGQRARTGIGSCEQANADAPASPAVAQRLRREVRQEVVSEHV